MNRRAQIETGLVVIGLAVLILGLVIGLDSMGIFIITLVVGLAVLASWALSYVGRRKNQ